MYRRYFRELLRTVNKFFFLNKIYFMYNCDKKFDELLKQNKVNYWS